MNDFRVWARLEHFGPDDFVVTVTAVPESCDPSQVHVLTETRSTRDEAQEAMRVATKRMEAILFRYQGRVASVEIAGVIE